MAQFARIDSQIRADSRRSPDRASSRAEPPFFALRIALRGTKNLRIPGLRRFARVVMNMFFSANRFARIAGPSKMLVASGNFQLRFSHNQHSTVAPHHPNKVANSHLAPEPIDEPHLGHDPCWIRPAREGKPDNPTMGRQLYQKS